MEKIVVTGYGIKAPNTSNIHQFLYNLTNGINCLKNVTTILPDGMTTIVGRIEEDLQDFELDKRFKRMPRVTLMGMAAGKEAVTMSKLTKIQDKKVGVFIGTSLGSIGERAFQESVINSSQSNFRDIPITFSHYANYHSITAAIAHYLGAKGITKTITTGCTSSLEAIEGAMVYLRSGLIDIAIVGGTDSLIDKMAVYGFAKTRTISLNQSLPDGAVPFSENSKGIAISEASGVIIMEREGHALQRSIEILGEIENIISNNDGVYIYSVDETGEQMVAALKEVIKDRQPDFLNSQALGIKVNDRIEERCSKVLFNHKVPYTSIKSMYGNPYGATGVLQVISSLLSINHGFIPPTIRTNKKGYEEMDIVTETRFQEIKEVAITNHGYGGNNACAYVKRYK